MLFFKRHDFHAGLVLIEKDALGIFSYTIEKERLFDKLFEFCEILSQ